MTKMNSYVECLPKYGYEIALEDVTIERELEKEMLLLAMLRAASFEKLCLKAADEAESKIKKK